MYVGTFEHEAKAAIELRKKRNPKWQYRVRKFVPAEMKEREQ